MKLPINEKPFIRTYPDFMFLDTIINNSTTNDSCISIISFPEDKISSLYYSLQTAEYEINGNDISIIRKGYDIDSRKAIWFETESDFEDIVFQIKYQQFTNSWDSVLFFVDEDPTDEKLDFYPKLRLVIGRYCNGMIYILTNGEYVYIPDKTDVKFFRIRKEKDIIYFYVSYDNKDWTEVYNEEFRTPEKLKIGSISCLQNNQYFKWLCNNFIMLKFNKNHQSRIDYVDFIERDSSIFTVHPFVKFSYEKTEIIDDVYGGLWNYIVQSVKNGKYIQLILNENYIPGTDAYNEREFYHESLIYGFDDVKKTVFMLIVNGGKPKLLETDYKFVKESWSGADSITFEFKPSINSYELDIVNIYERISAYHSGNNTTEAHKHLTECDSGNFGIKIYDELLNNKESQELLLQDIRIPFMIHEHKKCMQLRMEYLAEWGLFPKIYEARIENYINNIVNTSEIILVLIMKYQRSKNQSICERVINNIKILKDLETKCYRLFLNILESV